MSATKESRYLTEFELDTLIKLKYPAGLIVKGLLSELLENPRLFRHLTRQYIDRKKEQINNLKTQKTLSRLHRLWKLFEMTSVFPIFELSGISHIKSEKLQNILTSEYDRISCLTDKNRQELRHLRQGVTHLTFLKTAEGKCHHEKIKKLTEKDKRLAEKLKKLGKYLEKQ